MSTPGKELYLERIVRERAWVYERRIVDALPWPTIAALASLPPAQGGLGVRISLQGLRAMVEGHRADQGSVVGTREERIERRQIELDAIALGARKAIREADDEGRLGFGAIKVLLDVRAAEAKMHGDDAAQRIEAEVTVRDGVLEDLNASLVALGREPIREEAP